MTARNLERTLFIRRNAAIAQLRGTRQCLLPVLDARRI